MVLLSNYRFHCFEHGVLASEHYDQAEWLTDAGEVANLFFTIIFTIEMCLKLFGLGIRKYVEDNFNIFDGVIVAVSLFVVCLCACCVWLVGWLPMSWSLFVYISTSFYS